MLKKQDIPPVSRHVIPDLKNLIAVLFLQTTGIILEALDSERALEETWISNKEIIGVVFKDNFSYHLRFPAENVAAPNDNFGDIGNTKWGCTGGWWPGTDRIASLE